MRRLLALALLPLLGAPALAQKGVVQPGNGDPAAPLRTVVLDNVTLGLANRIELDGVAARVEALDSADDTLTPVFIVETLAGEVLRFEGEPTYFSFLPVTLQIVALDAATQLPEVVATSFTGGAHCCERIQIAAQQPGGAWAMHEFGQFDGGVAVLDIDDDGNAEIEVADQSFLYTFDCYACSAPPPRYFRVIDGAPVDISDDPRLEGQFRAQLETFDPPERVADRPGQLAGWTAVMARLGQGEEALARVEAVYRADGQSYAICTTGGSTYDCAPQNLQDMGFVDFLRFHLVREGYLEGQGKG